MKSSTTAITRSSSQNQISNTSNSSLIMNPSFTNNNNNNPSTSKSAVSTPNIQINSNNNLKNINNDDMLYNSNSMNNNNSNNSTNSSTSSLSRKTTKWIKQFCSLEMNHFLCKVDIDYIMDAFNLIGLEEKVHNYHQALSLILDKFTDCYFDSTTEDYSTDDGREIEILASAEVLYGLIHARYILTDSGLQKMLAKYQMHAFGVCKRYFCYKYPMLPVGLSDQPGIDSVRLYCPRCRDVYVPHFSSKCNPLDGAYFGTNFPHMFSMVFPSYQPSPIAKSFVPTLYGFKIHQSAYEYQWQQHEAAERAKKPVFRTISSANRGLQTPSTTTGTSGSTTTAITTTTTAVTPITSSSQSQSTISSILTPTTSKAISNLVHMALINKPT